MYWIYILKCEDDIYYVGQTSKLYTRFWEHEMECGGVNTSTYRPIEIVAIYKAINIYKFMDYNDYVKKIIDGYYHDKYDNWRIREFNYNGVINNKYYIDNKIILNLENNIVECMMIHNKDNWKNIRGGKYVRFDCVYKFPNNEYIKEIPLCNCGLPCDVKKHDNKESLFFRCAKKNMWNNLKYKFEIEDEPCKFYKEYLIDIELRVEYKKNFDERRKKLGELIQKSPWLEYVPCEEDGEFGECVWCDSEMEFKNTGITYHNHIRLLCFDCFINKNEELKKKYSLFNNGKCLISL